MGAIAAMLEEKHLHDGDELDRPDPRKNQRRVGDSDLEWGESTDDAVEKLSSDLGGMDIDPDVDETAYTAFVKRMVGVEAGEHVTMDDLDDMERMRQEDESDEEAWRRREGRARGENSDSESGGDEEDDEENVDEEVEGVLKAEEEALIAEPNADLLSESDTEDDDDSEIDSDEAFGESDAERFDDYTFRGSTKKLCGLTSQWTFHFSYNRTLPKHGGIP